MWEIIPAVEFGEEAMADWASWWRVVGSKTYHRSFMVSSQLHVAMMNSTAVSLVAHLRRKAFGSSDASVDFLLAAISACRKR